jgi:ADP-dependent NAD(P)H-hydrate dehydratase
VHDVTPPEVVTPELLRGWSLPDPEGSKQSRGQVVVIGGAATTPGGVALAGLATLRVGAGRVQLAVAESVAPALAATFPEAGVLPLPETDGGSVRGAPAAERLHEVVGSADAVLIGPGLDDAGQAADLLTALLPHLADDCGLVLDAYALGALSKTPAAAETLLSRTVPAVLTPNSHELSLLVHREDDQEDDPEDGDVHEAAQEYRCVITSRATIVSPDGRTWHVPQGHAGLATAGSGDVLAGLVVGLLGRGAEVEQAACWATYLHSTAGERLSSAVGGVGFLARELVDQVPPVLAELT